MMFPSLCGLCALGGEWISTKSLVRLRSKTSLETRKPLASSL